MLRLVSTCLLVAVSSSQVCAQHIVVSPRASESASINITLRNEAEFALPAPELYAPVLEGITVSSTPPCSVSATEQWVRLSVPALQIGESVSCVLVYARDASPRLQTTLVDFGGISESQGLVIEPTDWVVGHTADLHLRVREELPLPTRSSTEAFFRVSLENPSAVAVSDAVFGACSEGLPPFEVDGEFPGGCAAAPVFTSCNAFAGPQFFLPTAPAGGEASCQLRVRMFAGMSLESTMRMFIDPTTPQSETGYVISDPVPEDNALELVLQIADFVPVPALGWLGAFTLLVSIVVLSRDVVQRHLVERARPEC